MRDAWYPKLAPIELKRLIFLDESGVSTSMTRMYGRIIGGERLVDSIPGRDWRTTSIISSIRLDGTLESMTVDGPIDGDIFYLYVKDILCPSLQEGDIVVMDNLSCHKAERIEQAIKEKKSELWFLPPYSPDYNPIEKMWSKVKSYLRSVKARTQEDLDRAISEALATVSAQDAIGWFKSCSYTLMQS